MIVDKSFGAIDTSDVFKAIDPKGQRINNRFGQDNFGRSEAIGIPDASMRSGQIQVTDPAFLMRHTATVDLRDGALGIKDREDQRAVKMLPCAFTVEADLAQLTSHGVAVLPVAAWRDRQNDIARGCEAMPRAAAGRSIATVQRREPSGSQLTVAALWFC